MNRAEKYKQYFTKDFLMGPNSFRLLDEMIRRNPCDVCWDRTLDLGCGKALTSVFLANETPARSVYAFDLWVSPTENLRRIRALSLEDRIVPVHGDALDLPFARDWFDAVVSVDAYHYFGCQEGIFAGRILPFVRRGGTVMIAVPGLREEPRGETRALFETWAEGDDALCFRADPGGCQRSGENPSVFLPLSLPFLSYGCVPPFSARLPEICTFRTGQITRDSLQ